MLIVSLVSLLVLNCAQQLGGKVGETSGKFISNKITKKLFNREIFKKKVSDLSEEQLKSLLASSLDDFGKELIHELSDKLDQSDLLQVIQKSISEIDAKLDDFLQNEQAMISYMEQQFNENQDWISVNVKSITSDLAEEIKTLNENQTEILYKSITSEFLNFSDQFQIICNQIMKLESLIKDGQNSDEERYKSIMEQFRLILDRPVDDIKVEDILEKSLFHIGWITQNKEMRSQRDISYNHDLYVEREDVTNNFTQFINSDSKKLFLLVGNAGIGKTWTLGNLAMYLIEREYPVFYFRLRMNIATQINQIFGLSPSNLENKLRQLDSKLQKPICLFFDGYDEIREKENKNELINELIPNLKKMSKIKFVVSSRHYDWFEDNRYTVKGKTLNITDILWKDETNFYSVFIKEFNDPQFKQAFNLYSTRLENIPSLETWDSEIIKLAHSPLWLRFICELYSSNKKVKTDSLELYDHFLSRMGINTDKNKAAIAEIGTRLIKTKNKGVPTLFFNSDVIQELISANIIRRLDDSMVNFTYPEFIPYSLALELNKSIMDLRYAIHDNEKETMEKEIFDLISMFKEQGLIEGIRSSLSQQLLVKSGITFDENEFYLKYNLNNSNILINSNYNSKLEIESKNNLDLSIDDKDMDSYTEKIISSIEKLSQIYRSNKIQLGQISQESKLPIQLVNNIISEMVYRNDLSGHINNKDTINIDDDELILDEKWNIKEIKTSLLDQIKLNDEKNNYDANIPLFTELLSLPISNENEITSLQQLQEDNLQQLKNFEVEHLRKQDEQKFKLMNQGISLNYQKMYKKAEDAYRAALKIDPNFVDAWNNLGNNLKNQKKDKEAEDAYREALKIDSNFVDAWNNLGVVLYYQKKFKEAEDAYREALKIDPKFVIAWNGLGIALYYQKKYKEAEEAYRESLRLDPNYQLAKNNLKNILNKF